MNNIEVEFLENVKNNMNKGEKKHFPEFISSGLAEIYDQSISEHPESKFWSYIILEKLGPTLDHTFAKSDEISMPVILQIGIQIIDSLQAIH